MGFRATMTRQVAWSATRRRRSAKATFQSVAAASSRADRARASATPPAAIGEGHGPEPSTRDMIAPGELDLLKPALSRDRVGRFLLPYRADDRADAKVPGRRDDLEEEKP